MLPELLDQQTALHPMPSEFSSADRVISLDDTIRLLQDNGLSVGDAQLTESGELLAQPRLEQAPTNFSRTIPECPDASPESCDDRRNAA
jgi:hypothetical protein